MKWSVVTVREVTVREVTVDDHPGHVKVMKAHGGAWMALDWGGDCICLAPTKRDLAIALHETYAEEWLPNETEVLNGPEGCGTVLK